MKKLIILSVCLLVMVGCKMNMQDVCTQPSTLCKAAEKLNVPLKTISMSLKLGNIAGMRSNLYTAHQASAFLENLKLELEMMESNGATYQYFISLVYKRLGQLPPEVMALFIVVGQDVDLTIPELSDNLLTGYDYELLRRHLNDQKLLLVPFM